MITSNCYNRNSTIPSSIPTSPISSHYIQYDATESGIMGFVAGGFSFFEYHGAILDFIQIITGICSSVSLVIMFADTMGRRQLGRIVENNVIML
ncbi:unnamed protein product [Adineta steineri]|uniref:Uncharacterized protein n=1 Tax=Adineta steineri TaxID=433720 RepID=A0A819X7V5_9BILA|nr:unnamed protein product [Adineta steineri]CAF1439754.1 unnamed protein product [Adineta steineri]CAF3758971.1 unnamed protein product [Adineta steineri]CAF4136711.1 unnamed protein product [Adineta steineri]